jgi:SAM-dependent methyltransferase
MPTDTATLACPVGQTDDVSIFLEIPGLPVLCNVLSRTRAEAQAIPRGDLRLGFSPTSGHVYNYAFDPALLAYSQAYENSLHFSPRFQAYATALADHLIETYDLRRKHVVELGCGKGDFLQMLCARGDNRGLGFDPSYEPDLLAPEAGQRFTVIQDLYSDRYADHPTDLLVCRHVLEHIEQPRPFLETVRRALGARYDTAVFFEVPNVAHTLRTLAIWDLIYEHCSFFSPASLAYLFQTSGFAVRTVAPVYEGQFVTIEAHPASGPIRVPETHRADVEALARDVAAFGVRFREKRAQWEATFEDLRRAGKRAVLWGAGSKGVTILNLVGAAAGAVAYVVDINPRKQGMHVAGTGQAIVSPAFLADYRPDVVVVMNPIYLEEIRGMLGGLGLAPELLVA